MSCDRSFRVLYIAFYFPPSRASGVHRARATANFLASRGWNVTTLAAPMRFLREMADGLDEQLLSTVDPRIVIERPDFRSFGFMHNIREFSALRRNFPTIAARVHRWSHQHVFPENYASWGWSAFRRALRLHRRERFDLLVATGNPFAAFAMAWLFHRTTGVPYVIDYRDSWTLDQFNEVPAYPDDHIAWRWEQRIIKEASAVAFVNDPLRAWHAKRYPDQAHKLMVVPNGWDPDLMDVAPGHAQTPQETDHPLKFAYLGTVTPVQPVEELMSAFELACEHPDLANAELNIHGYLGFFKGAKPYILERFGLEANTHPDSSGGGIHYRGPVSKTDVASVYERSDVLVFLTGGTRYVTTGKIFEYMATGKPIVSVHAPDIAATEVLAGYPSWFAPDALTADAIAQAMIAAAKAARDLTPQQRDAGRAHAAAYTRRAALEPFEARLRDVIGRRRRPITRAG